jgi:hypothetical protein
VDFFHISDKQALFQVLFPAHQQKGRGGGANDLVAQPAMRRLEESA